MNGNDKPVYADMEQIIAVGFGLARLCRDGIEVIDGEERFEIGNPMRFSEAEALAAQDPYHKWTVEIRGPLYGATYQRIDFFKWQQTHRDEGFA